MSTASPLSTVPARTGSVTIFDLQNAKPGDLVTVTDKQNHDWHLVRIATSSSVGQNMQGVIISTNSPNIPRGVRTRSPRDMIVGRIITVGQDASFLMLGGIHGVRKICVNGVEVR